MIKVVVIEDRALTLDAIRKETKWAEYGIEPVGFFESCDEAFPVIRQESPDVVVTDIVMSGTDGLAFCKRLHEWDRGIRTIIISAHSRFDYAKKALQLGVSDFLEKPLDYTMLASCIVKAAEEKRAEEYIRKQINEHRAFYVERFFTRLLNGVISTSRLELEREMDYLDILLFSGRMACVTFALDSVPNDWDGEQREVACLLLFRALQEGLGENPIWGPFYMSFNRLSAVVGKEEKLTGVIEDAVRQIGEKFNVAVSAGIGCWCNQPEELGESYRASLQALEYKFILGTGTILQSDDLPENASLHWSILAQYEDILLKQLSVGDINSACDTIDKLYDTFKSNFIDRDSLTFFCTGVLSKVCGFVRMDTAICVDAAALKSTDTITDFFNRFKDLCREVCIGVRSRFQYRHGEIVHKLKTYLEDHYNDSKITLNTAAACVNMSANYVSTIFKRETGIGIAEYLGELRLDHAKKLLGETNSRIGEISDMCGYSSQYYFSMLFKKNTGLSPVDYRKKIQNH